MRYAISKSHFRDVKFVREDTGEVMNQQRPKGEKPLESLKVLQRFSPKPENLA
jgi:hypothetical protein